MKKFFFILLLVFSTSLSAQIKLSGVVVDKSNGNFLESANIYLPELQRGVVTKSDGYYEISGLPEGIFQVQFSYVGYKSRIVSVELSEKNIELNMKLEPSQIELGNVVVLGNSVDELEKVPFKVEAVSGNFVKHDGFISLQRSLTLLPGVSELSNGFSISKPVIRGLFGYRIAAIVNGLRFDNQEWQNEHGFGVNEVGTGNIEIIEGPAALLFGANVIGGAVNFVDPKFSETGKTVADVNLETFSNTLGANLTAGFKGSGEKWRWQFHLGGQSHVDYLDGNDERVPNTRFLAVDAKGILNYVDSWGFSTLEYLFSYHIHGVVEEAELDNPKEKEEEHFEREFEGPHHIIDYHIISLKNLFTSGNSKFKVNIGFQNNHREEEEGMEEMETEEKGELDVILNTFSFDAEWLYPIFSNSDLTIGTQGQIQGNENEGERILVPNADMSEFSFFAYLKKNYEKFLFEAGARYNLNKIETEEIGTPGEEAYFKKLDLDYNTFNGAAGASFFPTENWVIKLNLATGFRAPNLAEIASNGVHEGTTRYEIGDPNLESEQNYQVDFGITHIESSVKINVSAFNNHVKNFIYLTPTTEMIGINDVYRFVQNDADLRGGEVSIEVEPVRSLNFVVSFSTVIGKKTDGSYLPFMPADKIVAATKIKLPDLSPVTNIFINLRLRTYLAQNRNADNETPTPAYSILDAGVGGTFLWELPVSVSLNVTNILNKVYINHLSLLKPLGIYDMGRNISLSLSVPLVF
jgi:iron complex outermembrane receptor protein